MPSPTRVALVYLLSTGIVVGVWAYGSPSSFYSTFPGLGRSWVSMDGSYNQHLIKDAGAAYMMIAALSALALVKPALATPLAVGVATLVFNILHFAYHASHLAMYGAIDRALNVLALGTAVLASGWLVTPWARVRP